MNRASDVDRSILRPVAYDNIRTQNPTTLSLALGGCYKKDTANNEYFNFLPIV